MWKFKTCTSNDIVPGGDTVSVGWCWEGHWPWSGVEGVFWPSPGSKIPHLQPAGKERLMRQLLRGVTYPRCGLVEVLRGACESSAIDLLVGYGATPLWSNKIVGALSFPLLLFGQLFFYVCWIGGYFVPTRSQWPRAALHSCRWYCSHLLVC